MKYPVKMFYTKVKQNKYLLNVYTWNLK